MHTKVNPVESSGVEAHTIFSVAEDLLNSHTNRRLRHFDLNKTYVQFFFYVGKDNVENVLYQNVDQKQNIFNNLQTKD